MNTTRNLNKRLLGLFPVKILKEHFDETGNQTDLIELLSARPLPDIKNFISANHNNTKQSIYLFKLNKAFTRTSIASDFQYTIQSETLVRGEYTFLLLPRTTFSVYLRDPMEETDLSFYQPVIIKVQGKFLSIQFTKLEKKINSYFDESRAAIKVSERNGEGETLEAIISYFENNYTVTIHDINKGIKHLWHIDDIDCHKIQWRDSFSSRGAIMNGALTFKQQFSTDYASIILEPIGITSWKYLKADGYLCESFYTDPSDGYISITKYPKLPNQVNNVITKILANN